MTATLKSIMGYLKCDRDTAREIKRICSRTNTFAHVDLTEVCELLNKKGQYLCFGVEYLFPSGSGPSSSLMAQAVYLNTGDTYTGTLLWDYERGCYMLTSWGDYVEQRPRIFGE